MMAIRLVIEVMDWSPASLTHREHKVLMILAENARLPSREIWDSVVSPKLLRRAMLTERQMYETIEALTAKGCLVKTTWGGRNHQAKYAIARLAIPRSDEARWQLYLSRLSAAERQFVKYTDWWDDNYPGWNNQDQPAENPHTENQDQPAEKTETETPRSACGKPAPRLPVTTSRASVQAESSTGGETARRDLIAAVAYGDGNASAAISLTRDHDGPEQSGSQAQNFSAEVHLRSPANGGNARAKCAGCGQLITPGKRANAIYCSRQCKNAATKRRSRQLARAAS